MVVRPDAADHGPSRRLRRRRVQLVLPGGADPAPRTRCALGVIFPPADLPQATTVATGTVAKNGYPVGGLKHRRRGHPGAEPQPPPGEGDHRRPDPSPTGSDRHGRRADDPEAWPSGGSRSRWDPMQARQRPRRCRPRHPVVGEHLRPADRQSRGDQYQSRSAAARCTTAPAPRTTSTRPPVTSTPWTSPRRAPATRFDVHDGVWTSNNLSCFRSTCRPRARSAAASGYTALTTKYPAAPATARTTAPANKYCTGDGHGSSSYAQVNTTFRFLQPDSTPWNDTDNPPVTQCRRSHTHQHASDPTKKSDSRPGVYDELMGSTINPNDGVLTYGETFPSMGDPALQDPNGQCNPASTSSRSAPTSPPPSPTTYTARRCPPPASPMAFPDRLRCRRNRAVDSSNVTVSAGSAPRLRQRQQGRPIPGSRAPDAGRTLHHQPVRRGRELQPGSLNLLPAGPQRSDHVQQLRHLRDGRPASASSTHPARSATW